MYLLRGGGKSREVVGCGVGSTVNVSSWYLATFTFSSFCASMVDAMRIPS